MNRRSKPRLLLYTTSLVGVGHYFRTRELACALSSDFEVQLVDGGRSIPGVTLPQGVAESRLPPVYRDIIGNQLVSESGEPVTVVKGKRMVIFDSLVRRFRPDVVLIEYFPFQRWELGEELLSAINLARSHNPNIFIGCSVRDVPKRPATDAECERVIDTLNQYFNCVLVHGDERIATLGENFPRVEAIRPPIVYTGYVCQDMPRRPKPNEIPRLPENFVIVSAGGGVDALELMTATAAAWKQLAKYRQVSGQKLVFFLGPFTPATDRDLLFQLPEGSSSVAVRPFSSDFSKWLYNATLSISRAGYNTCADILGTSVPALLVPSIHVGDQVFRARRFADRGLVKSIESDSFYHLADLILDSMKLGRVERAASRSGTQFTREFLLRAVGAAARTMQPPR